MVPWAHPSPHSKWHLNQFSHFCRAAEHGELNRICQVVPLCTPTQHDFSPDMPFPLKIAPWHGAIWTPSNIWFFAPTQVHTPNGFLTGSSIFVGPLNIDGSNQSYSPGGANVQLHVTHASLGSPKSTTQMASLSVQPFLHR